MVQGAWPTVTECKRGSVHLHSPDGADIGGCYESKIVDRLISQRPRGREKHSCVSTGEGDHVPSDIVGRLPASSAAVHILHFVIRSHVGVALRPIDNPCRSEVGAVS